MSRRTLLAWLQASRLPSQSYIALPLLLGQCIYWGQTSNVNLWTVLWVQFFGVLDQLYIVYANDYADQETDAANRTATPFSGGSRVLVRGRLSPTDLKHAATLMALGVLTTASVTAWWFNRPLLVPLAVIALALLWLYSYPPAAMSYRGGGEWLQALGVGVVLPLYGYYAQAGAFSHFPWWWLGLLFPAQLACAVSTSLPDAPSDSLYHKRTVAVRWGLDRAKQLVAGLQALALAGLAAVGAARLGATSGWSSYTVGTGMTVVAAMAAMLLLMSRPTPPGSRSLSAFVFCSILTTLGVTATLITFAVA